jgi:hypothetical protein
LRVAHAGIRAAYTLSSIGVVLSVSFIVLDLHKYANEFPIKIFTIVDLVNHNSKHAQIFQQLVSSTTTGVSAFLAFFVSGFRLAGLQVGI